MLQSSLCIYSEYPNCYLKKVHSEKNNNNRYRNRSLLNIMDYTIITEPYEIIYILGEPPHTLLEGTYSNRKEKK